jgi:subtilisin family serine protease
MVLVMAVYFQFLQLPAFAYDYEGATLQREAFEAVLPDELLVKFRQGVGRYKRQAALAGVASRVHHFQDRNIGPKGQRGLAVFDQLMHVKLKLGVTPERAIADLARDPNVEYAEPNLAVHALESFPNDPDFDLLWGMDNTGQSGGSSGADIDAPLAWDASIGSEEVVVAVIDTGIDYVHPDLTANMWINTHEVPQNAIDDDGNGHCQPSARSQRRIRRTESCRPCLGKLSE